MTLNEILKRGLDLMMIVCPNIGYVAQIIKFRQLKSSEGFSKLILFICFMANILRIFFWVGKNFSVVLLYQSIVSIIMQIVLLRECILLAPNYNIIDNDKDNKLHKPINLFNIKSFWNWPFLIDYIYFLVVISIIIAFVSHEIGYKNKLYIEALGDTAATVEAVIGLPQVIYNFMNKNCDTLSVFMLICWACGDSFKTLYYLETMVPLQFLVCGIFQLTLDMILLAQYLYYTYIVLKKVKEKCYEDNKLEFGEELDST